VLAEFAQFFVDSFKSLSVKGLEATFLWIENVLSEEGASGLAAGLRVCFLENIAHTDAGRNATKYMGKKTKEVFDGFN
jgi:hypothetical protein